MAVNDNFVVAFQVQHGLNPDGIAGERTYTALNPRSWPLANLSDGRTPFVTNGYSPGSHDGIVIFFWAIDTDAPIPAGYSTPFGGGDVWYPYGTQALAAADGEVIGAEQISTGYLVTLEHQGGETSTRYFHGLAGTSKVHKGDTVVRGQPLFTCGWDLRYPLSQGNPVHLHFAARRGAVYIDPLVWLRYASYYG